MIERIEELSKVTRNSLAGSQAAGWQDKKKDKGKICLRIPKANDKLANTST